MDEIRRDRVGGFYEGDDLLARRFELGQSPEGREIREKIEKEYQRRLGVLRSALDALEIHHDLVAILPPVLDRADIGYTGDIDIIFFGEEAKREDLFNKTYNELGVFPFIIEFDGARLAQIQQDMPEFYDFIMAMRGNISQESLRREIQETSNFLNEARLLEERSRYILSPEQKELLKVERLEIGRRFIEDAKRQVDILGYAFSGSMMSRSLERFDISSDLDIDMLVNSESEHDPRAFDWIALYLSRRYARDYKIKVDVHTETLGFARTMVSRDPRFADFYRSVYGINIEPS